MKIDERILIGIVFIAFVVKELWTLKEWPSGLGRPFPFSDQEITKPTYIWMICGNIFLIMLFFAMQHSTDKAYVFFTVVFWLQVAELIEFLLNYNEPWFRVHAIPVNVTTLRYVILFFTGLYTLIKWKI